MASAHERLQAEAVVHVGVETHSERGSPFRSVIRWIFDPSLPRSIAHLGQSSSPVAQGAAVFLAPEVHGYSDGIVVQGSEGDWAGHAMDFAEWLYRYLTGEEMAGWGSAALHPGPVPTGVPPHGT